MATLYDMLGAREDATDEELKRAYRRAAMKAHPDRNVGDEASAHARFQEIKEAYAILSDPVQRRVYDEVYAEEMRQHLRRRAEEEARLQAEREARYTRFVSLAMRFAKQGHNRDVVFGVLLGRNCEAPLAGQIADSVVALHDSRQRRPETAARDAENRHEAEAPSSDEAATEGATSERSQEAAPTQRAASEQAANADARKGDERAHANLFSTLWHGMFGLRP
jgi:curved DNA-binding protein CbpA